MVRGSSRVWLVLLGVFSLSTPAFASVVPYPALASDTATAVLTLPSWTPPPSVVTSVPLPVVASWSSVGVLAAGPSGIDVLSLLLVPCSCRRQLLP